MKMHILDGGRLLMPRRVYVPNAGRDETIELPVIAVLLRHGGGNVLFDTGCHPDALADPAARWGERLARLVRPIGPPDTHVVAGLATLGLVPDDIDVVVNSHLHLDHCGCNAFFRRATFICHADEIAAAHADDAVAMGYVAREFADTAFDTVGSGRDIFGDGRLETVPLPGHTPGTMGLKAGLDTDGAFLLASDALSLKRNLTFDEVPLNARDPARLLASYGEIRRLERQGCTVICGHDNDEWKRLRKGAAYYA